MSQATPARVIGIEAKSRSEFRPEEVPKLILDLAAGGKSPPWL